MACCGQNRVQASIPTASPVRDPAPNVSHGTALPAVASARLHARLPSVHAPSGSTVALRYLAEAEVLVRGGGTGRSYRFSSRYLAQRVDARDVMSLLRTGLFRLG